MSLLTGASMRHFFYFLFFPSHSGAFDTVTAKNRPVDQIFFFFFWLVTTNKLHKLHRLHRL